MDCLSKDQLLLLQDKLSYTEYENFVGMFEQDEKIPVNPHDQTYPVERNKFIIETMKNKNKLENVQNNMKKNYNKNVYSNIENEIKEFIQI